MLIKILDFTVYTYTFCGLVTLTFALSASNLHCYYTCATPQAIFPQHLKYYSSVTMLDMTDEETN